MQDMVLCFQLGLQCVRGGNTDPSLIPFQSPFTRFKEYGGGIVAAPTIVVMIIIIMIIIVIIIVIMMFFCKYEMISSAMEQ